MIPIGRKGNFQEWITDDGLLRITGWARDGLNEGQICHNMGVSVRAFENWKKQFPAIVAALKKGREPVDIEVENALLKRALGYDVEETITEIEEIPTKSKDLDGKPITIQKKHIRKVMKHIPGETAAQIFWLKNRRPGRWRDKIEAAPDTANELLQSLMDLERRSKDD